MARHDKSKSRVTPKGTASTPSAAAGSGATVRPAGHHHGPSARWVPALMLVFFVLGVLSILLNYVAPLPGAPSNWYLLGGLALILGGIVTATQYR